MGSCGTFVLLRLGSITFKLFAAIDLYSVNCGHMALYRSAGCTAEFKNIGRNVVVASKSGPVETGPTIPVATALNVEDHNLLNSSRRHLFLKYVAKLMRTNLCRNLVKLISWVRVEIHS